MAPPIASSNVECQSIRLSQIDLQQKTPTFDPAGWYSVLHGHFPLAELTFYGRPSDRLTNEIVSVGIVESLQFLLLGIDRHPRLRCQASWLETLVMRAREEEVHVLIYGVSFASKFSTFGTREHAIQVALSEWEALLLARFTW